MGTVFCALASLLPLGPMGFGVSARSLTRKAVLAQVGAQPEIASLQILQKGQPVNFLTAATKAHQYRFKVTGEGFDASSRVLLNGKKIPTVLEGPTSLSARPSGIDLTPGELSLEVANRGGLKSASVIIDVVSQPSVLSLSLASPNVAQVGATVTLTGVGFTPTGNKLRFVKAASPSLRGVTAALDSSDTGTLTFTVPDAACPECPDGGACPTVCFSLDPAEYLVSVENANGLSNSLDFLVSSANGPIGIWGGNGVAVIVTDTQVTVEGDCFSGLISQTLSPDATGNFSLPGTYTVLAGPVRQGQQGTPAQFSGSINGNTMVMNITVNSQFTLGPFAFTFGDYETIVHPCL